MLLSRGQNSDMIFMRCVFVMCVIPKFYSNYILKMFKPFHTLVQSEYKICPCKYIILLDTPMSRNWAHTMGSIRTGLMIASVTIYLSQNVQCFPFPKKKVQQCIPRSMCVYPSTVQIVPVTKIVLYCAT